MTTKATQLRDLYEGGFDYETAIAMLGLSHTPLLRAVWRYFAQNE